MAEPADQSSWSATFGQQLTMHHLLPFSLRVGFTWRDRATVVEELARRLPRGFEVRARDFDNLGFRRLPESYRRRYSGWLQIIVPHHYLEHLDRRRQSIIGTFRTACPQPIGLPFVEILLMSSGLGTIRITHDVAWNTCVDLRRIHASQSAFIQSFFKSGARNPDLPDDLLSLLLPVRNAMLAAPKAHEDSRYQLAEQAGLTWPIVDFFVGLVVCTGQDHAPDPPRWQQLLVAQEIECITARPTPVSADSILSCEALLVVAWDESILAFAGRSSTDRDEQLRNAVEFFTLGTMHWTGLYDTDQLLYEALPFLFERGRSYGKLQLIRGVQAHLAELQHESKAVYLAEHEDDQKILSRIFEAWETEDLLSNLDKKSTMLMGIVSRLNDERLRDVGVFFTVLSLIGIVSNLGQHRQWDITGWLWSGAAMAVAVIGWWVLRRAGRS